MKMNQKGFTVIYLLVGIVILAVIGGAYFLTTKKNVNLPSSPKACTQEAKICPDGSSVGRTGENCEFSPCSVASPAAVKLDQNVEGRFCGGIAANLPENQCPKGYKCQLEGNYPDAGGKCIK